jgi:type II secretory pathway pseudopilin PulG
MEQDYKQGTENGSALVYILIAIALLAALTVSFMQNSSQQTSSQNTFKSAAVIQGQADIIRSSIQECILMYPGGDDCINGGSGTCNAAATAGTDPAALENYPINPDSSFYTNATNVTPRARGQPSGEKSALPGK